MLLLTETWLFPPPLSYERAPHYDQLGVRARLQRSRELLLLLFLSSSTLIIVIIELLLLLSVLLSLLVLLSL